MHCILGLGSSVTPDFRNCFESFRNCWAVDIVGPVDDMDCTQTRYAVMIISFLFVDPLSTAYDHRPRPYGSVPFSTTLEVQLLVMILAVPLVVLAL